MALPDNSTAQTTRHPRAHASLPTARADFSASGDDTGDDGPSLNALFANAEGSCIIDPGIYRCTTQPIIDRQDLDVWAHGATIKTVGDISGLEMSSHNCRVRGLKIDHRSNAAAHAGFYLYGHDVGEGGGTHHLYDCQVMGDDSLNANYAAYRLGNNPYITGDAYGTTGTYWNQLDNCSMVGTSASSFPYGYLLEGSANATRISGKAAQAEKAVWIRFQTGDPAQALANATMLSGLAFEGVGTAIGVDAAGSNGNFAGLTVVGCRFEAWDTTFAYVNPGSFTSISVPPFFQANHYAGGPNVAHFVNTSAFIINSLDPQVTPDLGAASMYLHSYVNPLVTQRLDIRQKLRAMSAAGDYEIGYINNSGDLLNIVDTAGNGIKLTGPRFGVFGHAPNTQPAANADTSGATLGQLETEVNELKAALRSLGWIAT